MASGESVVRELPEFMKWKFLVLAFLESGIPISIVKRKYMEVFLKATIGPVPTIETLFDQEAFSIERNIVNHVRFLRSILLFSQNNPALTN